MTVNSLLRRVSQIIFWIFYQAKGILTKDGSEILPNSQLKVVLRSYNHHTSEIFSSDPLQPPLGPPSPPHKQHLQALIVAIQASIQAIQVTLFETIQVTLFIYINYLIFITTIKSFCSDWLDLMATIWSNQVILALTYILVWNSKVNFLYVYLDVLFNLMPR